MKWPLNPKPVCRDQKVVERKKAEREEKAEGEEEEYNDFWSYNQYFSYTSQLIGLKNIPINYIWMTNIDQVISSVCKHFTNQYQKNFERLEFYSPIRGQLDINLLAIFANSPPA